MDIRSTDYIGYRFYEIDFVARHGNEAERNKIAELDETAIGMRNVSALTNG